jgi:uncharacterized membrane protein
MSLPALITLGAISLVLMAIALVLLVRTRREHAPHAGLITALYAIGNAAILVSAAGFVFHWDTSATPRFYHGMLTGIGIGSLLALIVLYLVGRWERRHHDSRGW